MQAPARVYGAPSAVNLSRVRALYGSLRFQPLHRSSRPTVVVCQADSQPSPNATGFDFSKFANKSYLDKAARRFYAGLQQGLDEEELLLIELGASSDAGLTEIQKQYKERVKEKLLTRADELRKEDEELKARLAKNITLGQRAYEYGEYSLAVKYLEQGCKDAGTESVLGGEAQLWLALAYQAVGREQDCIDLYKYIEQNHPSKKIRKQAADLRYIMEAPKLPLSEDDFVKIPLLQTDTWRKPERRSYSRLNKGGQSGGKELSYWDKATWDKPPVMPLPDKWYVRVLAAAVGVTFLAVCTYLNVKYASGQL